MLPSGNHTRLSEGIKIFYIMQIEIFIFVDFIWAVMTIVRARIKDIL